MANGRPAIEEAILYGLLIATGAIPLLVTLSRGIAFGVEATIGLLMVCGGMMGIVVYLRRHRRA